MSHLFNWFRKIWRGEPLKPPMPEKVILTVPDESTGHALFGDAWCDHAKIKNDEETQTQY